MLRKSGMVLAALTTTAISLAMSAKESAIVTAIRYFIDGAQAEDIDLNIDNKRICQWKAPSTWQLLAEGIAGTTTSIMDVIRQAGLWAGIPLAAGETLTMTAAGSGNSMEIEFDLYDVGDIKSTQKNGSQADTYQLFQVISNTDIVTAAGDWPLDQSDLDDLFPAFPGGAVVPASTRMHMLALFGGPCGVGKASETTQNTTRLKMLRDRDDILSRDMLGMLWTGDDGVASDTVSYLTDGSSIQIPVAGQAGKIKVFDPPVIFEPGQELNVHATIAETAEGGDAAVGEIKLGLLFDVEKLRV